MAFPIPLTGRMIFLCKVMNDEHVLNVVKLCECKLTSVLYVAVCMDTKK
jgi:hypothetical protein